MKQCPLYSNLLSCLLILFLGFDVSAQTVQKPNVVLIICDDLNVDVEGYQGHSQTQTPAMDKLMDEGLSFMQAHCPIPICAPSRSSFLTGIYPHTSGNFGLGKWYDNSILDNGHSIAGFFKANGYHTIGTGKMMHHHIAREYNHYENRADYGPFVYDSQLDKEVAHPHVPEPYRSAYGRVDGSFGPLVNLENDPSNRMRQRYSWRTGNDRQEKRTIRFNEDSRDSNNLTADELNAEWAVKTLTDLAENPMDVPFFMGVGFLRPHTPLIVPKRFFDQFDLDSLQLPIIKEGDLDDTHYVASGQNRGHKMFNTLVDSYDNREDAIKAFLQAYLACVASVDELIGNILNVIDNHEQLRENTIVILTSDHGWHNGQKDHLWKNSLWRESTQVPLVMRVPGITTPGSKCNHPVSLVDLFPTLIDLCDLPTETRRDLERGRPLDGFSLRPFLEDPDTAQWDGPSSALITVTQWGKTAKEDQNYALRSKEWRYIRYHNGEQELYDVIKDPYEWHNLAELPEYSSTVHAFSRELDQRIGLASSGR
jgi:iduronate 2-sulfatase